MQAGRGIDVHVEGVIMPLDLRTLVEVADQLGFAHPPGGGEQHVRLIGDRPDQPFRLRFPVAEVSRGNDAGDIERVHRSSFSAKIAESEQLYKSYYRNSIIVRDGLGQPLLHELPHLLLQRIGGGGVEDLDLVGEHDVVPAEGAEAVDGGLEDPVGAVFLVELVFGEMAGAGEVLDEVVVGHHVQPEADGIVVVLVHPTEDIGLAGLEVVVVFRVGDVGVHLVNAGEVELLEVTVFQVVAPHLLVVIEEVDGHHEPVADLTAVAAGIPAEVHLVFLVDGFLQPDQVGDVPVHALEAHQAPAFAFLRHRQGLVAVADIGGAFGP